MKKTLLEIVQDVGFLLETGEIGTITETYESEQIARIVKHVYEAMMVNGVWPHLRRMASFIPSADNEKPTHMLMQDNVSEIHEVYYNSKLSSTDKDNFVKIKYISPDTFLRKTFSENANSEYVDTVVDSSGSKIYVRNNSNPHYVTTFDNSTLVFDSYNKNVDDTIQESKIQAYVTVKPKFVMDDLYVPDLTEDAFPALFEESLSRASVVIRQAADPKAEQESKRQRAWLSRNHGRAAEWKVKYPNYGRRT